MKRITVLLALLSLVCTFAWADGGDRLITPEEKAFIQKAYQQLVELLPAAPEGVDRKVEELAVPTLMGIGSEKYPICYFFYADYIKAEDMGRMMSIAQDAKGMEEMAEQMSKITEEMQEAVDAGNNARMVELQAKLQAVMSGNATVQKIEGAIQEQKSQSMHVEVSINHNGADYYQYQEIQAPAHCTYAIRRPRSEGADKTHATADTILFFGPFAKKQVNETLQIYAPREKAESKKIHQLIISFQAEPELADQYIAGMNLGAINALTK